MRYTKSFLLARAQRAFDICGLDTGPAYQDGKARVGATYIAKSFSGWSVEQIVNEGGGVKQLSGWCNAFTAAELVAFLDGMMLGAELRKGQENAALKRISEKATGDPLTFEELRQVDAAVEGSTDA